MRFYDPTEGSITFNDTDIRELSVKELRQNIGFVSQEIYLFDGSIQDNICYSHQNFDYDKMLIASKKSQAHDFIEKLPQKYNTKMCVENFGGKLHKTI